MKTRYKILITLGLIILGVTGMNYYSYKDYEKKQKERIELFFNYNYTIDSITFTKVKKDPMGGLVFHGYFNDNEEEFFGASIPPYLKEFERNNVISGEFDNKNSKFDNGKTYTVSEILQLQNGETISSTKDSSNSLVDKF